MNPIMFQVIPTNLIPSASFFAQFGKTLFWGLIIIVALIVAGFIVRDKIKYQYYATILKKRQSNLITGEPESSVLSGKAGYFKKKSGKWVFRVKYGKMPWQLIETSKIPDPEHMIGNRVFYIQIQKDNLVQAKLDIDWTLKKVKINPVEDDTKFAAYLEMEEASRVLDTSKLTPMTVGMIVMAFIIVTGVIVFYFLTQA